MSDMSKRPNWPCPIFPGAQLLQIGQTKTNNLTYDLTYIITPEDN